MCETSDKITARHSFYGSTQTSQESSQNFWKSEMCLVPPNELADLTGGRDVFLDLSKNPSGQYYKRYEHDETPVKDSTINQTLSTNTFTLGVTRNVTPVMSKTDLELLEDKILTKMSEDSSQGLTPDSDSYASLDSNIKFFKTTVQQIFDNFYTSMQDFDLYKQKFQAILEKNKAESISEMEEFVKEMIQHIMSSESVSNSSQKTQVRDDGTSVYDTEEFASSHTSESVTDNLQSVIEAYKNDNYLTDSNLDDKSQSAKGETFNIFLLSTTPYVEIKINERNLMSEINIKNETKKDVQNYGASAEDLTKLAAKRKELEKYVKDIQECQESDRDIPVKTSSAKKNIYLNEDFTADRAKNEEKSFLLKLCNYICKKFRKMS